MKYIKTFEKIDNPDYIIEDTGKYVTIIIDDIISYLYDVNQDIDIEELIESDYFINFLKEIFVGKKVYFKSINKEKGHPYIIKKIDDITGTFNYNYSWYIKVISGKNDYLIDINSINKVYNYDAKNKPLHKEMKIKIDAKKYNL